MEYSMGIEVVLDFWAIVTLTTLEILGIGG
jgi:hypothetical protein